MHGLKSTVLNLLPTAWGWTGVELFFLISGFLIHLGFLNSNKPLNILTFYSKRFWRIYPPYLLALLFFCLVGKGINYYLHTSIGLKDLAAHVFLIHNLTDKYYYSINPSFWSLAAEIQLYLLYPVFLWIRKKWGINKALIITILIAPIFRYIGYLAMPGSQLAQPNLVFNVWFVWCAGALLAEKYYNGEKIIKKKAGLIAAIGFTISLSVKFYAGGYFLGALLAIFSWLAFFEWMLHAKSINTNSILSKAMIAIGLCSYSIYLIHQPLLDNMFSWFDAMGHNWYLVFIKVIPVFMLIFCISWILYKLIEKPSIQLGYYLRRKQ